MKSIGYYAILGNFSVIMGKQKHPEYLDIAP